MRGDAVTSAILMRDPDYVPVSSAFLMRGRHNRQDFEQSDGTEDLREHRFRDYLAQVTDKGTGAGESKSLMSVLVAEPWSGSHDDVVEHVQSLQRRQEQFGSNRILGDHGRGVRNFRENATVSLTTLKSK